MIVPRGGARVFVWVRSLSTLDLSLTSASGKDRFGKTYFEIALTLCQRRGLFVIHHEGVMDLYLE